VQLTVAYLNRTSLTEPSYFAASGPHHDLFQCLIYCSHCPAVCSWQDCHDALCAYEATLQRIEGQQEPTEVHPLYFLACSRVAAKDDPELRLALLNEIVRRYPGSLGRAGAEGGWLHSDEMTLLSPEGVAEKRSRVNDMVTVVTGLRHRWRAMLSLWISNLPQPRGSARLSPAAVRTADSLMSLAGQTPLKEVLLRYMEDCNTTAPSPSAITPKLAPSGNFIALLGGSGTGKTTAARLLAKLLGETALPAGHKVVEYTAKEALRCGAKHFAKEVAALTGGAQSTAPPNYFRKGMHVEVLYNGKWYAGQITAADKDESLYSVKYSDGTEDENVDGTKLRVVDATTTAGGVLVLDDAHLLAVGSSPDGQQILDDIVRAASAGSQKVAVVLTSTQEDHDKLCAAAPDLQDKFRTILLPNFSEADIEETWLAMCKEAGWEGAAEEGGVKVTSVATRQLVQRSTAAASSNARSVKALLSRAVLEAEGRGVRGGSNKKCLSVEDIVGVPPTPERIPALARSLQQLHECVGIQAVKEAVQSLYDVAQSNYHKELRGLRTDSIPLNRLFLGNPGTGKTTVAAIYGQILKHLKLLSKGDVITRKPTDFVGSVVGGTEEKTRDLLRAAQGCVLIIDEAYNLNDQQFGKAALNTLVECVSGGPGDDIAVILIGYERDVVRMLDEQNPGLRSRFDPAYAFRFDDFSDMELLQIFGAACVRDEVEAPIDVKRAAVKQLVKARSMKNFGNARAALALYSAAKTRMTQRLRRDTAQPKAMTMFDVLGRKEEVLANPLQCIEELQGGEDDHGFRTVLRQLGSSIQICKMENRPVDSVGNFIFTGAPGTGKTTVACKMAQMLHALGVLASDHVVLTTALDLTGQYLGQSKKVIEAKMEEARGGVLFIDEAYKLGEGQYGDEVMVKLLGMLTEPEYCGGKTIVILAGYDADMHRMLARNAGMASRFSESVNFADWPATQCVELIVSLGQREKPTPFVVAEEARQALLEGFGQLVQRPGWANARDAESMYKLLKRCRDRRRAGELSQAGTTTPLTAGPAMQLEVTTADAVAAVAMFLRSRPPAPALTPLEMLLAAQQSAGGQAFAAGVHQQPVQARQQVAVATKQRVRTQRGPDDDGDVSEGSSDSASEAEDDEGEGRGGDHLTPEQIAELQTRQAAHEASCRANAQELTQLQLNTKALATREGQARLQELLVLRTERQRQEAIRKLGRCTMGYAWGKVPGGYRCAGGSHFIAENEVERKCKQLFA
jgi:Cdc6-like AAA superfamily ATPase